MESNDTDFMFFGGQERRLGTLHQTLEDIENTTQTKFRTFGEHGPDATPPLILPANYAPTWTKPGDNNDQYTIIGNQEDQGACGCITGTEIVEICALKSGLPTKKLSWGQLYWSLNGGSDNGTYSGHVLKHLTTKGAASVDVIPINVKNPSQRWPQNVLDDALNYCIDEWFLCPTVAHIISALMQGFVVHSSMWWFANDNVDSNGWLSDNPRGKKGGHSIRQNEFIIENGRQGFRFPNTWTTRWGVNGFGKISTGRMAETLKVWPFFAARSVRQRNGNFPAPILP